MYPAPSGRHCAGATRSAAQSGDYTAAAAAFARLVDATGSVARVVAAFECIGVTRFYADHLLQWRAQGTGDRLKWRPSDAGTAQQAPTDGEGEKHSKPSSPQPSPPPPSSPPSPAPSPAAPQGAGGREQGAASSPPELTPLPTSPPPAEGSAGRLAGLRSWRDVPPTARPRPGAPLHIPRILIQTWKDTALPERYRTLVEQVRSLRPLALTPHRSPSPSPATLAAHPHRSPLALTLTPHRSPSPLTPHRSPSSLTPHRSPSPSPATLAAHPHP